MNYPNITVHGFRSTFSDWAADVSTTQEFVTEMALAHAIKNEATAAYRRGELLEIRRVLMEQWLEYINTDIKSGQVIPFKKIAIEEAS